MSPPQYIMLYNQLKRKIVTGTFAEGELLPSENKLTSEYQVARSTVRQALNELVKDGYINKKQGVGSIVDRSVKSLGLLSFKGFSDVMGKVNKNVSTRNINGPTIAPWMDHFFYKLTKEEISAGCIFLERIRFVDNDPVMLELTYIPNFGLSGLCQSTFVNNSLFQTLNVKYNIEVNNLTQDLRAVTANAKVSRNLQLTIGNPVLHVYRKYFTTREHFKIYSSLFCNTNKYAIGSNHG